MTTTSHRGSRRMTVGELSRITGVPVKALRRYADWGLVYTIGRSPSGYRLFDADALWCVRMIGHLRGLGLTLAEIRDLTGSYLDDTGPFGPRLAAYLRAARRRLSSRIAELQETVRRIDQFRAVHGVELLSCDHECLPGAPRRRQSA